MDAVKIIIIILLSVTLVMCVTLAGCAGGVTRDKGIYAVKTRVLNNDDTYTYQFNDSSYFQTRDCITTKKRLKVGDKFTLTVNKVKRK